MCHHGAHRLCLAPFSATVAYSAMTTNVTMTLTIHALVLLRMTCSVAVAALTASSSPTTFVILGGTGRIGTAVATHLLLRGDPSTHIILAGRNQAKGQQAVQQVLNDACTTTDTSTPRVEWQFVEDVWNLSSLQPLVEKADCLIHTAGPYLNQDPIPLQVAIASARCKTYVDVSDPLEYLEESLKLGKAAQESGTSALLCAGAFPGMSNVLAMEAASHCLREDNDSSTIKDVRFNYFTAGLGGSGDVNLYITNLGFGEPQAQYEQGTLRLYKNLSGRLLGKVQFYLNHDSTVAKERIGEQTVFAWPFPEAATVAHELKITGDSSAAMGTAPDFWNVMLGLLVEIVPRSWWKSPKFSKFMADFSQPLVKLTDSFLEETHGMRVDVTGGKSTGSKAVSIVQAHESFRQCVGQSCAEFALDVLSFPPSEGGGVQLPEQRYRDDKARGRILSRLTSTPGTLCYTGPVALPKAAPAPSDLEEAIRRANNAEGRIAR